MSEGVIETGNGEKGTLRQKIAQEVRFLRRCYGLTQKELGQAAGLSESTIVRFERGKEGAVTIGNVEALAQALKVSFKDLILGTWIHRLIKEKLRQISIRGGTRP